MIFVLTVLIWCGWYLISAMRAFNSKDAKERPWAYDHTAAIGATFGFFIHLVMSVFVGIILQVLSNIL